jgi:hypothetical protein
MQALPNLSCARIASLTAIFSRSASVFSQHPPFASIQPSTGCNVNQPRDKPMHADAAGASLKWSWQRETERKLSRFDPIRAIWMM